LNESIKKMSDLGPIFDGPHATPKKIEQGPFFLSISSLNSGTLLLERSAHLSDEDFKRWTKRVTPQKDDLLFSYETRLGEAALMPDGVRACLGRRMALLRPNQQVVNPQFLLYSYLSPAFQNTIISKTIKGATVERIALNEFPDFPIWIPSLADQQKIAKVLSTLDAKIELNNRINAELEGMAKLLYDYWFVQFDFPCLPDDYPSSGAGKLAKIAAACNYRSVGGLPIPQKGEYFIYVLLCADDSFYIGMTDDLYRRWFEHKTGQGAKWTKAQAPIKVLHHEVFDSRSAAAEREKELKTGFGRKWLKREYDKLSNAAPTAKKTEGLPSHLMQVGGSPAYQTKPMQAGSPAHQSKLMQAGKMVFNPNLKREIPEGWEAGTLDKLGEVIGGSTPSKAEDSFFCASGIPWITPKDLSDNKGKKFIQRGAYDVTEAGKKAATLKIMPKGTVLLSSRAPIGYTAIASNPLTTNQGFKSFVPNRGYGSDYIYRTLNHFMKLIEQNASGSTFKEISAAPLKAIVIQFPPFELERRYSERVSPISRQQQNLEKQNQELTELRDWLLPMLMNGQVRVEKVSLLL